MKGGPGTSDPERVSSENYTLKRLLMAAYGVEFDQISGPNWLDSDKYTIAAKIPPGTNRERFGIMLQDLLTERFKLTLHHDEKEFPIYALTVAKGGPKLTLAAPKEPNDDGSSDPQPGAPASMSRSVDKEGCDVLRSGVRSGGGGFGPGVSCERFTDSSMSELAKSLQSFVAMGEGTFGTQSFVPVVDQTGIAGEFDITLKFHLTMKFPGQVQSQARPPIRTASKAPPSSRHLNNNSA